MTELIKAFFSQTVVSEHIENKDVLDIGSRNVNGSLKGMITLFKPNSYHGIDLEGGKDVDEVISLKEFAKKGKRYDFVICSDVVEHSPNWWDFFEALPDLLKDRGKIFFTIPSIGYPFHPYEGDFWRFDRFDCATIFRCLSDCENQNTNKIQQHEKALHQLVYVEFISDLYAKRKKLYEFMIRNISIYNILAGKRISPKEWQEMNYED